MARTTNPAGAAQEHVPAADSASRPQMRAIVQRQYGTAEVLVPAEVDRPEIGPADVLVKVHAAGLARGTWHMMTGLPYAIRLAGYGVRAPKSAVLAGDVAGVVVAVGSDVTRFAPGDEVFGFGKSAYAEFSAVAEDKLALKPSALTFEQAAALPVSGVTALQGLCDVGHLQAGQRVLIIGASGGVGTHAVQIAKALGAEVSGVSSPSKVDLVRSLGADHVLDYTCDDFADGGKTYDLILDIGGNTSIARLRRALTPTGTLVISGGETDGRWLGGADRQLRAIALSPLIRQRLTTYVAKESAAGLERLAEMVEDGRLVPAVEAAFSLNDLPKAMGQLASGAVRGKLVITL